MTPEQQQTLCDLAGQPRRGWTGYNDICIRPNGDLVSPASAARPIGEEDIIAMWRGQRGYETKGEGR